MNPALRRDTVFEKRSFLMNAAQNVATRLLIHGIVAAKFVGGYFLNELDMEAPQQSSVNDFAELTL